jgi:hypothetical protein
MWQPDTKIETIAYPPGDIAPSIFALALFNYLRKAKSRFRCR